MQDKTHKNQGVIESPEKAIEVGKASTAAAHAALLESVSALMDGEASSMELRRVLKATSQNPEIKDVWQRYHLVRASLQQELHTRPAVNLLAGIHARLEEDQQALSAPSVPLAIRLGGFFRKTGQIAVAASVAFTVLYSASYLDVALQQQKTGDSSQLAVTGTDLPVLGGSFTPSQLTRTVSMDAAARNRIQQAVYALSENQQTPLGQAYIFPEEEIAADNAGQ